MANSLSVDTKTVQILPLHFNTAEHYLSLDEFINTVENTRAIAENINVEFFEGKLQYQIVVLPPKPGGFISLIGLCVIGGAGALWAFSESDIGKKFISGLTGHEPAHWAEQAGIKLKQAVQEKAQDENVSVKKAAGLLLKECAKGFLEKNADALRKIGVSKRHFRRAYEAKNEFFQICLKNSDIKGIGFDETHKFPITRADFPSHIVELPPEEDDEPEHDWVVEEKEIKVTSPVWVKDGRQWQASYDGKKETLFTMEDEGFWQLVEDNKLKPKIPDLLVVQWAADKKGKGRKKVRVLRVLEYNRVTLANPLTNRELNKMLTNHSIAQDNEAQDDLFNRRSSGAV
jgi:hypothetical protein